MLKNQPSNNESVKVPSMVKKANAAPFNETGATILDITSSPGASSSNEEDFIAGRQTVEDERFDAIIGELEDVLVSDEFAKFDATFCKSYASPFKGAKRTTAQSDAFAIWKEQVSDFLTPQVTATLSWFDMEEFLLSLKSHPQLEGDVFDFLATLVDFDAFKEKMAEHVQPTNQGLDFSDLLAIRPASRK
ncbi:hypothetical protein SmJEL517_g02204 [Synchytrium microbalum]|uniref:ADP-ribosylation factor-like protein 2-binding protein n=1 Tax=Synchytrium microbalum TaxID=1806994 RepID=A0A507C1G3_9FUNG|nr:uncharacterized protein SmJEL517_g02204 [Synchytrium microbalum]TPX35360.1 hypothetical protein SmJEL517_g02204 [Synchytrium microbalum]